MKLLPNRIKWFDEFLYQASTLYHFDKITTTFLIKLIKKLTGFDSMAYGKDTANCFPTRIWYITLALVTTPRIGSLLKSPGVCFINSSDHPEIISNLFGLIIKKEFHN